MTQIINDDCLIALKTYPNNYFTSIITDPPYGLSFMGKKWDYDVPKVDIWKEVLRVLKPGGTMLCFAGSRTQHRMAVNIEDAGFLIKDTLMYLYGSGFPKSLNIGKAVDKAEGNERDVVGEVRAGATALGQSSNWNSHNNKTVMDLTKGNSCFEGYGTALKPAYEPIIMCMKPNDGTYANNALKHGVAGINIDAGRIGTEDDTSRIGGLRSSKECYGKLDYIERNSEGHPQGRFPSNLILDEEAGKILDEQTGISNSSNAIRYNNARPASVAKGAEYKHETSGFNDFGGASRFFYCAKASKAERGKDNIHPTVKPLKLMEYLIKLIMPPKDGLLLDPFAGSGSTLVAAKKLGFNAVGIEREEEYCKIIAKRVANVTNDLFNKEKR